jgi:general secretion pathway protein G
MLQQLRARRDEGFTLIELLIVIIILGILATVVVFAVGAIQDRGQENACKTEFKNIKTALAGYYAENDNTYPPTGDVGQYLEDDFLDATAAEIDENWTLNAITPQVVVLAKSAGDCDGKV